MERNSHSRDGEEGIILLLTLFVIAIFAILVLEFNYTTRVELHIAGGLRDDLLASAIARGGIYETIARVREHRLKEIDEKAMEDEEKGRPAEKPEEVLKREAKKKVAGQLEEVNFPDYYGEDWAQERHMEPYGAGYLTVKVIDESGKIPINILVKELKEVSAAPKAATPVVGEGAAESGVKATEETKKTPRAWGQKDKDKTGAEVKEEKKGEGEETAEEPPARYVVDKKVEKDIMRLIETLDIRGVDAEEVTPAIVDWMDSDDKGDWEEDAYTRSEGSPPKNAPLDVLSELLLVEGVTGDLYFGPGQAEIIDLEKELSRKEWRKRGKVGLRDCLTVCSRTKVNVNTAPPEVLTALLEEENESLVKEIVTYTRRDYFKDMAQFSEKIGEHVPASFKAKIGVGSDSFQIVAEGLVNESRKQLQAFVYIDDKANVKILYWRTE